MKINKSLLIISMVLISLFAVGAVSAADSDNVADIMEVSDVNEEIEDTVLSDVDTVNEDTVLTDGSNTVNEDTITDEVKTADGERNVLSDRADVRMDIAVEENKTFNEDVLVSIDINDTTGTYDFSKYHVDIFIDDELLVSTPISAEGKSAYTIAAGTLDAGTYHIGAIMLNDTEMIEGINDIFTLEKDIPTVTVLDVIANIYENVTIPVEVADKNNIGVYGEAIVTLYWSGDSLSKRVTLVDGYGEAKFDFKDIIGVMSSMSMGDMMGMMGGDMDWSSMFGNDTDWSSMFGGNGSGNSSSWASMFGGNGSGNSSSWASMFGNDSDWGSMFGGDSDMSSMVTVTFEYIFTPGRYNVETTFLSDRNYETANATSTLIIPYDEDVVYFADITAPKKLGDNTTVKITVLDKYSLPIANVTVTATVDGKTTKTVTVNENGTGQAVFENLVNGAHKLVLQSDAGGNTTSQSFDFNVTVAKVNVTITAKNISVQTVNTAVDGKAGKYLTVTLKDSLNNTVSGKKVKISINNQVYTVTTNKNGVAKLQINIAKAGTYTAAICLLGDDDYNGAFAIAKVTVNKQTPKLTTAKKTYKASAKTKKLTATFKSAKGKAIKGKKITFTVNKKTYTATTNAKGIATVNVKLTKKGTYTFTAKFAGDNTYKAVSKKAKLVIK